MEKIIECVPNFSEGHDLQIINQITSEIEAVEGVSLLNTDPGKTTNRTVVTFVGPPDSVIEAAFRAIKKAGELIDMRKHKGEHPRMGATDVCPLIPVANITLQETAEYALKLAKRVGEELQIPVYLYEAAQSKVYRKSLSVIRAGEYEGFFNKIKQTGWEPDFGPLEFDAKRGSTVIGAREFLIAYNINLNTTSVRRANAVAFDVRESGRLKKLNNKPVLDANGNPEYLPGSLKSVKAIGWFIEEYGFAQISMNLTNIEVTPLHIAFDEVCQKAVLRGLRVTGSELIGLIPLKSMLDAGKYFLKKQKRSVGVSERELVKIATQTLGLSELDEFKPEERIIEYRLKNHSAGKLTNQSLSDFADETASESPAPGGGSVAAYLGSLGAALATMVANLSAHKKGWEEKWEEYSEWAEKGQACKDALLELVNQDTEAFQEIMASFSLPKFTSEELKFRTEKIQEATLHAMEIPMKVMQLSLDALTITKAMAEKGNPNSVSDAGVAALCARSAVLGAFLNVRINARQIQNKELIQEMITKGTEMQNKALSLENEIIKLVTSKIGI